MICIKAIKLRAEKRFPSPCNNVGELISLEEKTTTSNATIKEITHTGEKSVQINTMT